MREGKNDEGKNFEDTEMYINLLSSLPKVWIFIYKIYSS